MQTTGIIGKKLHIYNVIGVVYNHNTNTNSIKYTYFQCSRFYDFLVVLSVFTTGAKVIINF